jgi:pimeloyl-ACP methyl ester carboxylesterase
MTAFVLIPGAGGSAWYWHLVAPHLRAAGHEVIAVDLPAADDQAGLSEYTDTVLTAVGDRDDLVVVGQSMGGLIAPLVCSRRPVRHLVLVNAMVAKPGESGGQWWGDTGQAEAREQQARKDGRPTEFDLLGDFFHDVPAPVVEAAMAQGDQPQSERPFADPWPLSAWPQVPTRILIGRDDRFFPPFFQHRVARERLGRPGQEIPGGHLAALSRPVELAAELLATLDQASLSS